MSPTDTLPPDIELAQLLQRCAAHDPAAFRTLYDKTSPILFARLLRMLRRRSVAEEALQDVYVRIWERAAQYEAHRGRALAWMVTIARYCAIDLMRRERMTLVRTTMLRRIADESAPNPAASTSLTTSIYASVNCPRTRGTASRWPSSKAARTMKSRASRRSRWAA